VDGYLQTSITNLCNECSIFMLTEANKIDIHISIIDKFCCHTLITSKQCFINVKCALIKTVYKLQCDQIVR
jgi:hypothetical protein